MISKTYPIQTQASPEAGHVPVTALYSFVCVENAVLRCVKYPLPNLKEDARTLTQQARRKLRKNSTSSASHLTRKWARLNKHLRICRTIERIVAAIPQEGVKTYHMNNFDLQYDRMPHGVMIAGIVGGLNGNESTTIVTALSGSFLTTDALPRITKGMIEMATAVMAHGNYFDHYSIDVTNEV